VFGRLYRRIRKVPGFVHDLGHKGYKNPINGVEIPPLSKTRKNMIQKIINKYERYFTNITCGYLPIPLEAKSKLN